MVSGLSESTALTGISSQKHKYVTWWVISMHAVEFSQGAEAINAFNAPAYQYSIRGANRCFSHFWFLKISLLTNWIDLFLCLFKKFGCTKEAD